jgi:hypothetical protein
VIEAGNPQVVSHEVHDAARNAAFAAQRSPQRGQACVARFEVVISEVSGVAILAILGQRAISSVGRASAPPPSACCLDTSTRSTAETYKLRRITSDVPLPNPLVSNTRQ